MSASYPPSSQSRVDTPRSRGDRDAPHESPVTPAEDVRSVIINKVNWGAILAGVALALVIHMLVSMIGIGIGVATLDPGTSDNPSASSFSIAAAIWWAVAGIIASFAGGFAAGRLAGVPKESTASWHGLTSWAATTLVIFYLLTTTLSSLIGGTLTTVTSALGGMASTATTAAASSGADPFTAIQQAIQGQPAGAGASGDQAAVRDAAIASVRALLTGTPSDATAAREQAAEALSRAQGIPIEQARTQVEQYEQQYRQTAQQATEIADTAASTVSTGALLSAVALILGAIAAWFGGRAGAIVPTMTGGPGIIRNRMS
jgi:hypothetical protein